jgi:dienelactone hydrolase
MCRHGPVRLTLAKGSLVPVKRTFNPVWNNSTANPNNTMYQLSSDTDFNFEMVRVLNMAVYEGSDIAETLLAVNNVIPGNFESFTDVFTALANRTLTAANAIDAKKYPVSSRNALFKAATYLRSADFFTHGNWSDPRIQTLWTPMLAAFEKAISLYPMPGRKVAIPSRENFTIPAYFFPGGEKGKKRPTLVLGSGYDGTQEEMWHLTGKAAVERGFNVLTYEGPGQQTVRRQQGLGFIPQWEKVVTPVVDYLLTLPEVDPKAIGLVGVSFGGHLAPRAAAFERRLAATIAIDGILDFGTPLIEKFTSSPILASAWNSKNQTLVDAVLLGALASPQLDTTTRWFLEQGLWAFNTHSPYDFLVQLQAYTLEDVVQNISSPVFVAEADQDPNFPGQARQLADMLGDRATYHLFRGVDGAGLHCSLGASVLLNQVILDWFQDVVRADAV